MLCLISIVRIHWHYYIGIIYLYYIAQILVFAYDIAE